MTPLKYRGSAFISSDNNTSSFVIFLNRILSISEFKDCQCPFLLRFGVISSSTWWVFSDLQHILYKRYSEWDYLGVSLPVWACAEKGLRHVR